MTLQGNLRDCSTIQLLNRIRIEQKSGTLTIHKANELAILAFREGRMIYGERGHADGRLVPVLRHYQFLTDEQAAALLARPEAADDNKIIPLLIQAKLLSQQDIFQAVQKYFIDLVHSLFSWSEGAFQFWEGRLPPGDRIMVLIDLETLIAEGERRMREQERPQGEIPDQLPAPPVAGQPQAASNIQPPAKTPASAGLIRRIADRTPAPYLLTRENALALLFCLILMALIIFTADQSPRWIYQGY